MKYSCADLNTEAVRAEGPERAREIRSAKPALTQRETPLEVVGGCLAGTCSRLNQGSDKMADLGQVTRLSWAFDSSSAMREGIVRLK